MKIWSEPDCSMDTPAAGTSGVLVSTEPDNKRSKAVYGLTPVIRLMKPLFFRAEFPLNYCAACGIEAEIVSEVKHL